MSPHFECETMVVHTNLLYISGSRSFDGAGSSSCTLDLSKTDKDKDVCADACKIPLIATLNLDNNQWKLVSETKYRTGDALCNSKIHFLVPYDPK